MMRNGRRYRQHGGYVHAWFLVCLVIGGAGALAGVDYSYRPVKRTDCDPVVWIENAGPEWEAGWDQLRGQGWRGRAEDGMEAIYPPGCAVSP
jgi:hypothetical protein